MDMFACIGKFLPPKSKGLKQEQGSKGDQGGGAEASASVAVCAVAGSR